MHAGKRPCGSFRCDNVTEMQVESLDALENAARAVRQIVREGPHRGLSLKDTARSSQRTGRGDDAIEGDRIVLAVVRLVPADPCFKISTIHLLKRRFDWLTADASFRPTLSGFRKMPLRRTPQHKTPRHRAHPVESRRSDCAGIRVAMLQATRRCCRNVASRRVRDLNS
jgi:hypothetical protein